MPNQFFSISSTMFKVLDTIQIFPYVIQTDKSLNDLSVCRMTVPVTTFTCKLRDNRKTITVLLHIKSYISF